MFKKPFWQTVWTLLVGLDIWRCSSQHKSRYLFLDKGQEAENLKPSKDSVLVKNWPIKHNTLSPVHSGLEGNHRRYFEDLS